MLGLMAMAFAQDPLRVDCTDGDAEACERLAVELAARIVAADDDSSWRRLAEVKRLLEEDADNWPRSRAGPQEPDCPGDYGCREELPVSAPDGWTESAVSVVGDEPVWLLTPSKHGRRVEIVQGPRLLVHSDARTTLLDHAFCFATFTNSATPSIAGITGRDCTRFIRLDLEGLLLEERALSEPAERVASDGETHVFDSPDGVVIGVFDGRPVLGLEDGQVRWPDNSEREACVWYGQWLCYHRQLWWTLDDSGTLAEPFSYARPSPQIPRVEPPTGVSRVHLSAGEALSIAVRQALPWRTVNEHLGGSKRLWTGELGPEPVGPIEARSGRLLLGSDSSTSPRARCTSTSPRRPTARRFRCGFGSSTGPDGKVLTLSGEGRIDRSLSGIALVTLSNRHGMGNDSFLLVVVSDRRVLTLSPEWGLGELTATPPLR